MICYLSYIYTYIYIYICNICIYRYCYTWSITIIFHQFSGVNFVEGPPKPRKIRSGEKRWLSAWPGADDHRNPCDGGNPGMTTGGLNHSNSIKVFQWRCSIEIFQQIENLSFDFWNVSMKEFTLLIFILYIWKVKWIKTSHQQNHWELFMVKPLQTGNDLQNTRASNAPNH